MRVSLLIQIQVMFGAGLVGAVHAQNYEAYFLNNRQNYPDSETNWSDNAQGVAHDQANWFIATTSTIWKIPVGHDLRTVSASSSGVVMRPLSFYLDLVNLGYNHLGDPVVFQFHASNNEIEDYLLVPIEDSEGIQPGAIMFLRCTDLTLVNWIALPNQCDAQGQFCNDAGWCAVDSIGRIYASRQHATSIICYEFSWEDLHANLPINISMHSELSLKKENGSELTLVTAQGGEFAPGDKFLYLVSGFYNDSNSLADQEGIHVVKLDSTAQPPVWRRVAHSTRGYGHFDYYYNPGFETYEEPEGLTIWDLDGGQAPGIRGQLHVMVLDNDTLPSPLPPVEADDIDFKHYTNIIRVVANGSCAYAACCTPLAPAGCPTPFNESCEFGVAECPFRTIGSALDLAWEGAEIRIGAATYTETMIISTPVRLTAEGGAVRIGG